MEVGEPMDKILRKFTSHEEARAETYRYWRSRSASERFQATWELSRDTYRDYYRQKGIVWDEEGSARSLTRIQRPER
jgi:G3E family GTPase